MGGRRTTTIVRREREGSRGSSSFTAQSTDGGQGRGVRYPFGPVSPPDGRQPSMGAAAIHALFFVPAILVFSSNRGKTEYKTGVKTERPLVRVYCENCPLLHILPLS